VDLVRGGTTVYSSSTITETMTLGSPVSGDVVLIKPGADASGNVIPFTENQGEVFPIAVPSGVTLQAAGSAPVYVASVSGGAGVVLFTVGPVLAGNDPTELTTFASLHLAGASTAISVARAPGERTNLRLDDVRFLRNEIGLLCTAGATGGAEGVITASIEDCWVVDDVPYAHASQPAPRSFSIGLAFRAVGEDGGLIEANLDNLRTYGEFPDSRMARLPLTGEEGTHDLEPFSPGSGTPPTLTRLVEVYTKNADTNAAAGDGEHGAAPGYAIQPVPRVFLTANGGTWHGRSTGTSDGWDLALYADSEWSGTGQLLDYSSYWDARLNGTTIRNFRAAGIYARAWREVRGWLGLQSVTIRKTGQGYTAPGGDFPDLYDGVHAVTDEAYMVVEAANSQFLSNAGNGMYLLAATSIQASDMEFPTGLYVDLDHCEMHGNGVNGLFLDAAPNKPHYGRMQGGIVGGTWDFYPAPPSSSGVRSLIADGTEPDPDLPRGQGIVDGCAISNNGRRGVVMRALGTHFENTDLTAVSVRFVNTYVWNHPLEGWLAQLEEWGSPQYSGRTPLLLAPLVHCTLAYNDQRSEGGATAEVRLVTSTTPDPRFYWDDTSGIVDDQILITSFANTIFERPNPTWDDFGPTLQAYAVFDTNPPGAEPYNGDPTLIGWAGIRATDLNVPGTDPESTGLSSPFEGPIAPASYDLEQFFIKNLLPPSIFESSPGYLNAGAMLSEDAFDVEGFPRPALLERDKGGEEG